jgi:peptidoglycan-N-acetylglucosamine deacetylase
MHKYFIKTPWIVRRVFSSYTWKKQTKEKVLYLTFDDGPHPEITLFVLDQLKQYNAFATFFCVGDNVVKYPEVYLRLIEEGHAIGNHTFHHLDGWRTVNENYLKDVNEAAAVIDTVLFRPPYGHIRRKQAKQLSSAMQKPKVDVVMWDVLSADFDNKISAATCTSNVLKNATEGSLIVFHDSEKAYPNMKVALAATLKHFSEKGFRFAGLGV